MHESNFERNLEEVRLILDIALERFNASSFIARDPISIPHRFSRKEDIEISGFLIALIAWGNRASILKSGHRLMQMMDDSPYHFVVSASDNELNKLKNFIHRTLNGQDILYMIKILRLIYENKIGLEEIFSRNIQQNDITIAHGIRALHAEFFPDKGKVLKRCMKHLPNIDKGSAAKRINMFLRWMVRKDKAGVDFGIWDFPRPSQLVCPLDVHSGRTARLLGLLTRKQNDWKAALELTENLKLLCPEDPIKYDLALFGLGTDPEFRDLLLQTNSH